MSILYKKPRFSDTCCRIFLHTNQKWKLLSFWKIIFEVNVMYFLTKEKSELCIEVWVINDLVTNCCKKMTFFSGGCVGETAQPPIKTHDLWDNQMICDLILKVESKRFGSYSKNSSRISNLASDLLLLKLKHVVLTRLSLCVHCVKPWISCHLYNHSYAYLVVNVD